jgi:hydroxymethylglutaryl-CoA lyase
VTTESDPATGAPAAEAEAGPRRAAAQITIQEVGPRDGLQNEQVTLTADQRLSLIGALAAAGLTRIEVGSFVRPEWIPQLAGTDEVARRLPELRLPASLRLYALVPNQRGLEQAAAAGLREVAVFLSASDAHNRRNTNKSIEASLREFEQLVPRARGLGIGVRGYVSVVWGCPYEGKVDPLRALEIADRLRATGCAEISLGDTIGVGDPFHTQRVAELFLAGTADVRPFGRGELAFHFHDTHGTALANVYAAWQAGGGIFDAAIGGTGGCPYAPGAAGNLPTEDLVSMFEDMGIATGVDLAKLFDAGVLTQRLLGRKLPGHRLQAELGRRARAGAPEPGEAACT